MKIKKFLELVDCVERRHQELKRADMEGEISNSIIVGLIVPIITRHNFLSTTKTIENRHKRKEQNLWCCFVFCCVVSFCVVLCDYLVYRVVLLCRAVIYFDTLCCVVLCGVVLYFVVLCCVRWCAVMSCFVLCHVVWCGVVLC